MSENKNYSNLYKIEGTTNFDQNPCFCEESTYPNFQEELTKFKDLLKDLVANEDSKTFYKFGDGDYYFLKKESLGSASPGKRALSVQYSQLENHQDFVDGVSENDYFTCEIYPSNRKMFAELYPEIRVDYPAEFGYGLTANRWLTKTFAGKIGLIGAHEKLQLIEHLLGFQQYKDYLGTDNFTDYISIPQKFACDNLSAVEDMIAGQILQSSEETRIYLLGIGHVKSGLLHRLKDYKDAVFLDVGSGIDALAGIIDPGRPYMGSWKNHLSPEVNYQVFDFLNHVPNPNIDVILRR